MIFSNVNGKSYTYLLISRECTLYLLSRVYLPGLASGSIATLFLYLVLEGRNNRRRKGKGSRKSFKKGQKIGKKPWKIDGA